MSDESHSPPSTPRFLQVFKEESGRPGTRLLRRVGVEQVDQRRTDPPEAVPRHEAAPGPHASSPGNGCSALKEHPPRGLHPHSAGVGGLTTGSSTTKNEFLHASSGRIGSTSSASIIRRRSRVPNTTHIWFGRATDFDLERRPTAPPPSRPEQGERERAVYLHVQPDRRTALDLDRSWCQV